MRISFAIWRLSSYGVTRPQGVNLCNYHTASHISMTWDRWELFQGCWIVGKIHTQWKFVKLSPNSDFSYPLRCYHNEHGGISHHQLFHCLLNHSCTDQSIRNESSRSLAFVRGIHPWPVDSSQKGPVTPKMFSFDDIIMIHENTYLCFSFPLVSGVRLEKNGSALV